MELIREYAVRLIAVSVLAILAENLIPQGTHKKYINLVIGLVVMLVVAQPLTKLPFYDPSFSIPWLRLDDNTLSQSEPTNYVVREFEARLAKTAEEKAKEAFNREVSVEVAAQTDEEGAVTGIASLTITPRDEEILQYLYQEFGLPLEAGDTEEEAE